MVTTILAGFICVNTITKTKRSSLSTERTSVIAIQSITKITSENVKRKKWAVIICPQNLLKITKITNSTTITINNGYNYEHSTTDVIMNMNINHYQRSNINNQQQILTLNNVKY